MDFWRQSGKGSTEWKQIQNRAYSDDLDRDCFRKLGRQMIEEGLNRRHQSLRDRLRTAGCGDRALILESAEFGLRP